MTKNITNTERIANELLLEKYKPLMVIKLSNNATNNLQNKLEKFALDVSKKTKYEVLIFPNEEKTEVKIVSVCGAENISLEELQKQVYKKNVNKNSNTVFTTIKEKLKRKND